MLEMIKFCFMASIFSVLAMVIFYIVLFSFIGVFVFVSNLIRRVI